MIIEAFGSEHVERELDQWFMAPYSQDPTLIHSELEQRLNYLLSMPNKSTSTLLLNHKKYLLKFICTSLKQCSLTKLKMFNNNMSKVLTVVLMDDEDHVVKSQSLIDLLKDGQSRYGVDAYNVYFRELHTHIRPIDSLLPLYELLNANNKSSVITLFGSSFQQHYNRYESSIISLLKDTKSLVLLNGIFKCFGTRNANDHMDIFKPILDRLKMIDSSININNIDHSIQCDGFGWGLLSLIDLLETNDVLLCKSDYPIDKYMDIAIAALLVASEPFATQSDEDQFIEQHRPSLERYIRLYSNQIVNNFTPISFLNALARHSMLDGELITNLIRNGGGRNRTLQQPRHLGIFLNSCRPDPVGAWIKYIDREISSTYSGDLEIHTIPILLYNEIVNDCPHVGSRFHILKYLQSIKLFTPKYIPTYIYKTTLLDEIIGIYL
ncbi:hypothetical protein SAMD00019534_051760 [Acytostelium subglobosum LB1]|uniref:hypothetical protein n=1 Tax=Acytostelium subglobosum LB1 TaxID=1410327 RepID=UPI0006448210|nr:hypothetical protein SAMD00019534_051760 [Acytostelium subglobosum LB1]GAM22001.1 hypothetical protein SAMD00019534_051760 [Acytostelium subglobosum LB1]|eukprot:XP_012755101.1 hypothetical protein SAMD00019534_051760 [Acytostelium subglobosum LB1]